MSTTVNDDLEIEVQTKPDFNRGHRLSEFQKALHEVAYRIVKMETEVEASGNDNDLSSARELEVRAKAS